MVADGLQRCTAGARQAQARASLAFQTRYSSEKQRSLSHAVRIPQAICIIFRKSRLPHDPSTFYAHMWL